MEDSEFAKELNLIEALEYLIDCGAPSPQYNKACIYTQQILVTSVNEYDEHGNPKKYWAKLDDVFIESYVIVYSEKLEVWWRRYSGSKLSHCSSFRNYEKDYYWEYQIYNDVKEEEYGKGILYDSQYAAVVDMIINLSNIVKEENLNASNTLTLKGKLNILPKAP